VEEELRKAEANYREIFEKASTGIFILDAETMEIIHANQKSAEITGFERQELLQQHPGILSAFYPHFSLQETASKISEAVLNEQNTFEWEIKTKSGSCHWIEVSCNHAVIAEKKRILIFFHQIDSRKHIELTNAKITSDLIQRNANLHQFAHIVSHNLRAPVSSILGLSHILNSKLTEEEKEKTQQFLFQSVNQLDVIVKDLNHILEIRSEDLSPRENVNLYEVLERATKQHKKNIVNENIHIVSDFSEAETVPGVRKHIQCIFDHLLSNSIHYKNNHLGALIHISSKRVNRNIVITFKDNGLGIDLKQHGSKLFGLYNRFHSHKERKGMGLFLVKNHVENMGGSISVVSELNQGTEFTIVLPLPAAKEEPYLKIKEPTGV
jgi:PAS domain S-box-containing protein